jgi:leucyl aminopeptidase (aminopeptidase T)
MNGTIVIDGSWDGRLLEDPISFQIEEGLVAGISGGDLAEEISAVFEVAKSGVRSTKRDQVWTVAEFGFGMNPKATKLVGNRVEDLVVRGSSYFGFGDNSHIGGDARVGIHLRGSRIDPEVTLEDSVIVSEGKIAIR